MIHIAVAASKFGESKQSWAVLRRDLLTKSRLLTKNRLKVFLDITSNAEFRMMLI